MIATIKRLWKKEHLQTIFLIAIVLLAVSGFFIAEILGLVRVVPTGSMCVPYDGSCDGWNHPFERTIHVGDILIIQPVDPATLNTNYPNSDIIVYHTYYNDDIVHRIVDSEEINGTLYFYTKGDGNGFNKYPAIPIRAEYDSWPPSPIPQDMVVGKVIIRIPWVGNIAIYMQSILGGNNSQITIPLVVTLIILLVMIEFVLPIYKNKRSSAQQNTARAWEM